jgi:hypothetical protein
MRLFAICAVLAGALVGVGAAPASADELCDQVWASGDLVLPTAFGGCEPYDKTLCHWEDAGADPQVHVWTYICVPDPTVAP